MKIKSKAKKTERKQAPSKKQRKFKRGTGGVDGTTWKNYSRRQLVQLANIEAKARTSAKCYQMFIKSYVPEPQISVIPFFNNSEVIIVLLCFRHMPALFSEASPAPSLSYEANN